MTRGPRWEALKRQMDHDPNHELHGTRNGYAHYNCRCRKCRLANADYMAEFRERRRVEGYSLALDHGKVSTYKNYGCRCAPCTEANHQYMKEYRNRAKNRD